MTNKLLLVLINVLITLLNTEVLQGSVSTRLRCDGIFNDQCESEGENISKIDQHLPKLWAIKYGNMVSCG